MYEGSRFTRNLVIALGIMAVFQFARGFLLRLVDTSTGWKGVVACSIEVVYVTMNISIYWVFAFKYYKTSLEIQNHVKTIQGPVDLVNDDNENFSLGLLGGEDDQTNAVEKEDKTVETLLETNFTLKLAT